MTEIADPLVLDLVEWIAREPRPYSEVIESWRTSCPRLTIRKMRSIAATSRASRSPVVSLWRSPPTARNSCARIAASVDGQG